MTGAISGAFAAAVGAAAIASAPSALADPALPLVPLPPVQDAAIPPPPGDPGLPPPPADPAAATVDPMALPQPVQHLSSPENLPPGTSAVPVGPPQGRGMSYLRELWHAVQTQDVTMNEAIFLLTQRPLDANAAPPPGMPAGPQAPLPVEPVPAPVPGPAPAP